MFCFLSFPKVFYWQPPASVFFKKLFGCTIKQEKKSFISSQWLFLYRCHLLNVSHPKCLVRPRGCAPLKGCPRVTFLLTNVVNSSGNTWFVPLPLDNCHIGFYWEEENNHFFGIWLLLTPGSTPRLLFAEQCDLVDWAIIYDFFRFYKPMIMLITLSLSRKTTHSMITSLLPVSLALAVDKIVPSSDSKHPPNWSKSENTFIYSCFSMKIIHLPESKCKPIASTTDFSHHPENTSCTGYGHNNINAL